ncbi:MAG: hypothetical protein RR860_18165, partial [Janthinobacterium sp.]
QGAQAFGHDFLADAVAGDDCDSVCGHALLLLIDVSVNDTGAASEYNRWIHNPSIHISCSINEKYAAA